jgi:hypothetical protein
MKRRNFLKSIVATLVALPLVSIIKPEARERIYLRRGEVLQGRTFTKDVTVYMERDTSILGCRFNEAELRTENWNGGDPRSRAVMHCTFDGGGNRIGIQCHSGGMIVNQLA